MSLYKAFLAPWLFATITGPAIADESRGGSNEAIWSAIEALEEKVEMTAEAMDEQLATGMGHHGASGKTSIGGYGELHYNNLDSKKEMDFHRAILFLGHEFNERIRFWSELEVEHSQAGEGKSGGEVAMEQAFLEFDLNENLTSRAGLLLVPMGILNETHEPPTFYGVERNPVENKIIPTTWREGGVSLAGRFSQGFSYDLAVHSGLETSAGSNYAVRSGRMSVREAPAEDLAYTGRIKWTGMPGIELAAGLQYQTDVTQSTDTSAGSATLLETHAIVNRGAATLKALYATWNLNGSGPAAAGSDEQTGWYIEPSYKLLPKLGVFARYNEWDNTAGPGSMADTKNKQTDVGLNYWPHENVVVKIDVVDQSGAATDEGFNLGIGYHF